MTAKLNIPNFLTSLRILLVPFFNYMFLKEKFGLALLGFIVAGVTDLLDGLIARGWKSHTKLGAILDPAADKFLMTVTFIVLSVAGAIPIWLTAIVLLRDLQIIIGVSYLKWIRAPMKFRPTFASKVNTFIQLVLLLWVFFLFYFRTASSDFGFDFSLWSSWLGNFLPYLFFLSAGMTILTSLQYTVIAVRLRKKAIQHATVSFKEN